VQVQRVIPHITKQGADFSGFYRFGKTLDAGFFAVLSALADDFASDLPADTVDHGNKTIPVVEFVFAIFVECLNSVRIVLRCWECCKADIKGIT
jgi:hypothetical protein